MKKAILIAAIVLVALIGLTSYNPNNPNEVKKGNGSLIAQIKTGGSGTIAGGSTNLGGNTGKKFD